MGSRARAGWGCHGGGTPANPNPNPNPNHASCGEGQRAEGCGVKGGGTPVPLAEALGEAAALAVDGALRVHLPCEGGGWVGG